MLYEVITADLMIVVAYGLLLPKAVLDAPRLGCINVHGSLLPRWRGAAPIQRAIWAGDAETGITIMQMDEGLDTGAMLSKLTCPIGPEDTSASLYRITSYNVCYTKLLRPVSSPSSICMMVIPVSRSPARMARWMGAAPRQRGSREAWMLTHPRRGTIRKLLTCRRQ